jgi:protease-4
MSEKGKKGHGCLWATAIAGVTIFGIAIAAVTAWAAFRGMAARALSANTDFGADEFPAFEEVWASGQGDAKVVRIPLRGMILLDEESGIFGPPIGSTDTALASIQRATHDPDVAAIILDVDSGGGGITASDALYHALENFRLAGEGRKVIAFFGDVAASGAYYASAGADCIVARPTTITGSIGVLIQTLNFQTLAEKVGVQDVTIKSGANKDMLNPFRKPQPEQVALLQGVVDDLHDRFVRIVAEGRSLEVEVVEKIADGRVFTAQTALDLGLVDEIGYWETVVDMAAELLEVDEVAVYRYERSFSLSSLLHAAAAWDPVRAVLGAASRPRLMYLWRF